LRSVRSDDPGGHVRKTIFNYTNGGTPAMIWSTPAYEDLRLGFEINLYINNR
jgi:coenzyme PQQ precursor peptide PqqA